MEKLKHIKDLLNDIGIKSKIIFIKTEVGEIPLLETENGQRYFKEEINPIMDFILRYQLKPQKTQDIKENIVIDARDLF